MATQRQRDARLDMMYELEELQDDLSIRWLDQSLPDDWTGLDWREPVGRHKTRVTVRLDSDMLSGIYATGSVGSVIGTGAGRGIALLTVLSGIGVIAMALAGWAHPRVRHLEADLPDQIAEEPVPA